jgi:hypothetical protein
MSDMYDTDELVDLHPSETTLRYVPHGYGNVEAIAYDLWMLANIVENEFPRDSDEAAFAQKVFSNLEIMKWRPSK